MKTNLPQIVKDAIYRMKFGDKDIMWSWFQSTSIERESVDRWIITNNHPLGIQPGTKEYRFKELVKEICK